MTTWAEQRLARASRVEALRRRDPRAPDWPYLIGEGPPEVLEGATGPRVAFVGSDWGGAGRVRSFWPALALAGAGARVTWAATKEVPLPRGVADVVVFHRPILLDHLTTLRAAKAWGATVLIDEDDHLEAIWPGFDFGRYEGPGRAGDRFSGRAFYEQVLAEHAEAIAEADGLVVSTARLVEVYGHLARRTWVIGNHLPGWIAQTKPWLGHRPPGLRIGWAGIVGTHAVDLAWLRPHARAMFSPGVRFNSIGDPRVVAHLGLPAGWCQVAPFEASARVFYRHMARADVGIVPLDPREPLNWSKSYLKALEFSLLGVPVVATDLPEQRRLIRHGETGFLASTAADFAEAVRALLADHDLRERMGAAARERARAFTFEQGSAVRGWAACIEEARSGSMLRR